MAAKLAALYSAYLENEDGLSAATVREQFAELNPSASVLDSMPIIVGLLLPSQGISSSF